MKQTVIQILLIILFHALLMNAQSCNGEPFAIGNNITTLFNITPSGSCWCNNYIGNGSQLLVTPNSNLMEIINLLNSTINTQNNTINTLMSSIAVLEQKLAKVTISNDTNNMYFTGINLTVVSGNLNIESGSGATNGSVNGLGNLIVGYNENDLNYTKTGSHNIVVGNNHGYSSYGGIVGGNANIISGTYSFAVGQSNTASGNFSSVSSGISNIASGFYSSVSGGQLNIASGNAASVSGGAINTASSVQSSVSGGASNTASATDSSVAGGNGQNNATPSHCVCT